MTLDRVYAYLNFWINKSQGAFYAPEQLDQIMDLAQLSVYNDYYNDYAKTQRLDDSLAPFKKTYTFDNTMTAGGLIITPNDYVNLLSGYTVAVDAQGNVTNKPIIMIAEDQLPIRLNSQVIPISASNPIGTLTQRFQIQLYPKQPASGIIFYLRRPAIPFFSYTVVSGSVIVYNSATSTQLEWADNDIATIMVKALDSLGINMSEQDVLQWAQQKDQQNILTDLKI